jgi:hypothetical protein
MARERMKFENMILGRRGLLLMGPLVGALMGATTSGQVAVPAAPGKTVPVVIGLSHKLFIGLNPAGAEASFQAYMVSLAPKQGYLLDPRAYVCDASQFHHLIRTNPPQVAVMDSWEFVSADLRAELEPCYVAPNPGEGRACYVLLAHRRKEFVSPADLRGRELMIYEAGNAKLGRAWLEVLLKENNLPPATNFFSNVETVIKPTAALLPAFFRKKAACVITIEAFQAARELNPQLGQDLVPLATSPSYVESVLCVNKNGWNSERERNDFLRALEGLQNHTAGKQLLQLFKAERLQEYQPALLDSVRELRTKFEQVQPAVSSINPGGSAP